MDNKSKNCTLSVALLIISAYVLYEGFAMVALAEQPPFRITAFRVNPGMLPVILGGCLLFFTILLLIDTLRHESNPLASFFDCMKKTYRSMTASFGKPDFISMLTSVAIMFVYCFLVLGRVPFWFGGVAFLMVLMCYLKVSDQVLRFFKATNFGILVVTALAAVAAIILLFVTIFKTSLP